MFGVTEGKSRLGVVGLLLVVSFVLSGCQDYSPYFITDVKVLPVEKYVWIDVGIPISYDEFTQINHRIALSFLPDNRNTHVATNFQCIHRIKANGDETQVSCLVFIEDFYDDAYWKVEGTGKLRLSYDVPDTDSNTNGPHSGRSELISITLKRHIPTDLEVIEGRLPLTLAFEDIDAESLIVGDLVTVRLTVTYNPLPYPPPNGGIRISDEVNSCEFNLPFSDVVCELNIQNLGKNVITADYSGSLYFKPQIVNMTLNVGLLDSALNMFTSPSPSKDGEMVTVSVEMEGFSSSELPTGGVTISVAEDGYTCTTTLQGDEVGSFSMASCNWMPSKPGTYLVTADFPGDHQFNPSSASMEHTVEGQINTSNSSTTTIESIVSPSYSLLGQTAYFNVSVSGSGGTPTGTVEVSGAGGSCTATLDENGEGSCSYQMNQIGWNQTITASYEGDSTYDGSSTTESYGVTEPTPGPDSDGDGVPDSKDACPNEGDNGYGLEANGCPTLG